MYINAKGLALKTTDAGNQNLSGPKGGVRIGTAGADLFNSSKGETLTGGLGDDVYQLWDNSATIVEKPSEGTDTVYVKYYGGYTLAPNVENAFLQTSYATFANGNALNLSLIHI